MKIDGLPSGVATAGGRLSMLSDATEWNAREHAAKAFTPEEALTMILNVFATLPKHGSKSKLI